MTEINEIPNRGHSLTIDGGWEEVAQTERDSIQRFVKERFTRPHASEAEPEQGQFATDA